MLVTFLITFGTIKWEAQVGQQIQLLKCQCVSLPDGYTIPSVTLQCTLHIDFESGEESDQEKSKESLGSFTM